MQDKDSEALRNQRRRRKRIARMKHTIIAIIAGWIILSMILIIFLLVRTRSMERKLDELWQMQRVMNQQVPDTEALPQEETGGMDTETVAVTASASGIDETDNLAQDGDVHKVYLTFDDGPSENTDAILDVTSRQPFLWSEKRMRHRQPSTRGSWMRGIRWECIPILISTV